MNSAIVKIKSAYDSMMFRVFLLMSTIMILPQKALALAVTDLTQDQSGGQNFGDMADNLNDATQQGATLTIQIITVFGFVVVGISLYALWKASKEERESPMGAIVGLVIGGAMAGVGSVMWIMRNTVVGV